MRKLYHVGVSSVCFDHKAEGVCTGRLVRSLLDKGADITLFTSKKAKLGLHHENLKTKVFPHRPRMPGMVFNLAARSTGFIENNFYLWTRRVISRAIDFNDVPDLFYGRSWPHASLIPAYYLAKRYSKPLILHFSDPFPPPNENKVPRRLLEGLQEMMDQADALTFTNEETIEYQSRFLKFDKSKAYILPHVTQAPRSLANRLPKGKDFYFIGTLAEPYLAELLIKGFLLYSKYNKAARLYFVGTSESMIDGISSKHSAKEFVKILPFTEDVNAMMAMADVLLSIDVNVNSPVCTPTKICEYLSVNRKILAVTPDKSPTDKLLKKYSETCISVNNYSVGAIAEGFDEASNLNDCQYSYQRRHSELSFFSGVSVAEHFMEICHQVVDD